MAHVLQVALRKSGSDSRKRERMEQSRSGRDQKTEQQIRQAKLIKVALGEVWGLIFCLSAKMLAPTIVVYLQ